jgi:hypothetical protein
MMSRRIWTGAGMLSVAAMAFAGGRLSQNAHQLSRTTDPRPVPSLPSQDSHLPPGLPADVRNLAAMSFSETFQALKATPPETLQAWAKNLENIKPSPAKCAAITTFFKTLIQVNPPAAKKMILELKEDSRWVAMFAIKDAAPPRAMKEVVEILLTYDRGEISGCSFNFLGSAFEEWSRNDPVAVKQFLEERRPEGMVGFFGVLVRNWAAYDPESARSWMMHQFEVRPPLLKWEEGESRSMEESEWGYASEGMIGGWAEGFFENDRAAALSYLLTHDDEITATAIPGVAAAVFAESPEEARGFVLHLPAKRQAAALRGVAVKTDRFGYQDGDEVGRSPEFVANWMLQFPSEVWSENIEQVVREWSVLDAPGVLAWIGNLPADTQSTVVAHYSFSLTADSAEKDFNLVMEVPNLALRQQLLERLMQYAKDARAPVLASLEKSQLPQMEKARLAALIPPDDEPNDTSEDDDE